MARIHITEIQHILFERGELDALPPPQGRGGQFLEIRFDDPKSDRTPPVDEEFRDKAITVDCPYGVVTLQFDRYGQLMSLDLS